mgnify:CR=1 FL=1
MGGSKHSPVSGSLSRRRFLQAAAESVLTGPSAGDAGIV